VKYSFPQLSMAKSRFLTYNVVKSALVSAGNTVDPKLSDDCDAVLFSACDVMDILELRKLRKLTRKPIIIGGHYAMNYWSAALYADYVWLGEIFGFANIKSFDELRGSPNVYVFSGKEPTSASTRINWSDIPITQIKSTSAYYWGGSGCKNHCRFCFTSWTHSHQENSRERILKAREICDKRKIHLMVVSNEYDYNAYLKTKDMLLVDYIKRPVIGTMIRCGVEFATEGVRRKMGKAISKDDICAAIQKMTQDNIGLKLFHITGYEPLSDWESYINDLASMLHRYSNNRLLQLEFNNLQYQNYTPLYRERKNINPENYIDYHVTKRWYDILRSNSAHVLIGAPSPFKHAAARTGLEQSSNIDQSEFWVDVLLYRDKFTTDQIYKALFTTGIMSNPERRFNPLTGSIKTVSETSSLQN
jgi:hypothetical protein